MQPARIYNANRSLGQQLRPDFRNTPIKNQHGCVLNLGTGNRMNGGVANQNRIRVCGGRRSAQTNESTQQTKLLHRPVGKRGAPLSLSSSAFFLRSKSGRFSRSLSRSKYSCPSIQTRS